MLGSRLTGRAVLPVRALVEVVNDLPGLEAVLGIAAAAVAAVPRMCAMSTLGRAHRWYTYVLALRLLAGRGMDDGHNWPGVGNTACCDSSPLPPAAWSSQLAAEARREGRGAATS